MINFLNDRWMHWLFRNLLSVSPSMMSWCDLWLHSHWYKILSVNLNLDMSRKSLVFPISLLINTPPLSLWFDFFSPFGLYYLHAMHISFIFLIFFPLYVLHIIFYSLFLNYHYIFSLICVWNWKISHLKKVRVYADFGFYVNLWSE